MRYGKIRKNEYLQTIEEFQHVQTPILTPLDCEGAGELFQLHTTTTTEKDEDNHDENKHFFGQNMYLTVSGQLYGERGLVEVVQGRRVHVVMGGHATDGR